MAVLKGLPGGFRSPCASRAGPRGLSIGGPEDCQEVSAVDVQQVGRIGGPRKDCREVSNVNVKQDGRIGGPRKDCQEILKMIDKRVWANWRS